MSTSPTADDAAVRFPSLDSLRLAHSELLKRHRDIGSTPKLLTEIEEFIYRGQATGALLDIDEDRWTSQSLLDYWTAIFYRAGHEPPDATLTEFDPSLAPELDDALCPYLGLEAFRESSHNLFYGRQRLVEQLVNKLKDSRLLAVVGFSGSGKSSVVLGGLLPSLKAGALPGSENWRYYSPMVSGTDPLASLSQRIQPSNVNAKEWTQQQPESFQKNINHLAQLVSESGSNPAVLVVDQFEEVFTLCGNDQVRQAFIDNLIGLIQSPGARHTVILTMRTDFESQVARVKNFMSLFEQAEVRVTAMDASELREAIEKPAALVGLKFEEGLVDALLQDVLGEPAALPLLQFTLLKLWDNRERNRVTWETYKRLGGGRLALARSADEFYNELIPEDQVRVKRILLRMVRPTEGLEVTSNRIQRKTLYQIGEVRIHVDRVLNKLIEARLVRLTEGDTPEDAQVEVAHEALVRNWPQLVTWIEDERVTMRQRLRLTVAAEHWRAKGRDQSAFLRGTLLNDARSYEDLNELEAEFVNRSIELEENLRRQEEERRERELSQERKALNAAQTLNKVKNISAVVLTGLTIFAFYLSYDAQKNAREAARQNVIALAQTSEAFLLSNRQLESLVTAVQAGRKLKDANWEQDANEIQIVSKALQKAIYNVQERNRLEGHSSAVNSVSFSPDGKTLASGSADTTIKLWNVATGKELKTLNGHSNAVYSVSFSPDGKILTSGSDDKTIKLWDMVTGKELKTLNGHSRAVRSVSFSPDGKTLTSGSDDTTIKLWDVATGKELKTLKGHSSAVNSVSFSPNGKTLASGSFDTTIKLWNVATGKELKTLNGHSSAVYSVSFSPDGKTLASGSIDTTIKLWDVATGKEINILSGHSSAVNSVSFSPDGKTLVSGSIDTTIKLWNVTGRGIKTFNGRSSVNSVNFSPNGKLLASGNDDQTIKLWGVATGKEINTLNGHSKAVYSVSFSPDGETLASGSIDKTIKLWRVATGKEIKTLNGHSKAVYSVSFSPDGETLASGSDDKTIKLWGVATGEINTLKGHSSAVYSVSFSPDGKILASGSDDQTIKLWDVATGKEIKTLKGHSNTVLNVSFSPDGKTLASASFDTTIKLWGMATGKEITNLNGHSSAVWSVSFSLDGKTLASGSIDTTIKLWNVATGKEITTLSGHRDGVLSVSFSPDGKTLASGSVDKTVKLWNIYSNDLDDLMIRSCNWLDSYLRTNPNVSDRTLCDGIGTPK